jgi:predicted peptidase
VSKNLNWKNTLNIDYRSHVHVVLLGAVSACCLVSCAMAIAPNASPVSVRAVHELVRAPSADVKKENERKMVAASGAVFLADNFTASNDVKLMFRLLKPADLNSKQKLPLIVMMHGSGQIGIDNEKHLGSLARSWAHSDIQSRFPAYVLVPQLAARGADYAPADDDGKQLSFARPPLEAVMQLVEKTISQYAIDPDRIYIVGFSMGASGAWNALMLRPNLFAAAVPISGVAPDRKFANVIANTSVMIVHGNADNDNPIASDRAMFAALSANKKASVQFTEYDGLDHAVPPDMVFATAWREWLFAQRRKAD